MKPDLASRALLFAADVEHLIMQLRDAEDEIKRHKTFLKMHGMLKDWKAYLSDQLETEGRELAVRRQRDRGASEAFQRPSSGLKSDVAGRGTGDVGAGPARG